MTLQEIPSECLRERCIPVLETERLVLRAPRLGDAKAVAMLANDRRIAESTARIPHPYRLADAEDFITTANLGNEAGQVSASGLTANQVGPDDRSARVRRNRSRNMSKDWDAPTLPKSRRLSMRLHGAAARPWLW